MEWLSGNGLRISDSVIQGWSLFGVRVSNQRGGFGGFVSENVYYEASPCKEYSPLGNVGNAGIVAEGVSVKLSGLAANGASGQFPNWVQPRDRTIGSTGWSRCMRSLATASRCPPDTRLQTVQET